MTGQAVCPAYPVTEYAPEQREAAREFCQTLTRARTDRRAFAQILTDAFIRGMDAQEELSAAERPGAAGA